MKRMATLVSFHSNQWKGLNKAKKRSSWTFREAHSARKPLYLPFHCRPAGIRSKKQVVASETKREWPNNNQLIEASCNLV